MGELLGVRRKLELKLLLLVQQTVISSRVIIQLAIGEATENEGYSHGPFELVGVVTLDPLIELIQIVSHISKHLCINECILEGPDPDLDI